MVAQCTFGNISYFPTAGDDVVACKHGEKSAHALSSAGFRDLTFRTYNGYDPSPAGLVCRTLHIFCSWHWQSHGCLIFPYRLGHYTIPEETDEVCNWLTARLGLEGSWS